MFQAEGAPSARAENRSTPGMFWEEQGGWRSRCRLSRGEVGGDKVREVTGQDCAGHGQGAGFTQRKRGVTARSGAEQ